jgi:hypothetical protein
MRVLLFKCAVILVIVRDATAEGLILVFIFVLVVEISGSVNDGRILVIFIAQSAKGELCWY